MSGMPAALPAWLPPETSRRWVSGPQPLCGRAPDRLREVPQRRDAGVGAPVGAAPRVVVAVVGGGALVDAAVRPDPQLDALPVVAVVALGADDRHAAQSRGVGVVGPVLDVEVARPGARAVSAQSFGRLGLRRPAVEDVDEGRDGQALVAAVDEPACAAVSAGAAAAAAEVDRQRPRAVLEGEYRHVPADQAAHLVPVGGDQRRLVAATVGERRGTEDA